MSCPACGHANRPTAKFCDECGAPLGTAAPAATSARKVVSIVFADLVGSTALHERLDAESARRVMERYYEALRTVVAAHGGTVVKLLGDGVMAAFGLRQVAEDDAIRAVRAGVAMQEAFRDLVRSHGGSLGAVGLRVAVNTGEVVVSGAHDDLIGDPVNVAARLQEQGRDGDVVIGEATRRLVATRVTLVPLGTVTLKGRAEAVGVHRVASLAPPAGAAAGPFVGRDAELARLRAVFEAARATPAARLAVLLGSPGLGKSRLMDEVGRRIGAAAAILRAHCDAAGGATFAPLAQAVRAHLGLADAAGGGAVRAAIEAALPAGPAAGGDGERLRIVDGVTALVTGAPAAPEETFFVVRRFLAGLATVRPVVLVIDDFHSAEPLLFDLVEHLVQWGSGVPLLVLVGARPELRDTRPALASPGGVVADVVALGGLDAGAATRLAAHVIGAADLPAAVAAKVLATSEGNPLFVGELVRMLVHEGALQRDGERWIVGAGLASLAMPPTVQALLAARIERLDAEERAVLERAAVVGRQFSRNAVACLSDADAERRDAHAADLDARLERLRRSDLVERDDGSFLGEPAWRFHHGLIRDAAYRRLLKGTRAELHARVAAWIAGRVGAAVEHDETIGWHLEQAHQHLAELGPLDAEGRAVGARAARHLAAAGRRALARDDLALASGLLGRALARLDDTDPGRADLAIDWCEALLAAGEVGTAVAAIAELARFMAGSERLRAWHTCFQGQRTALTAPRDLTATVDAVAAAAARLAVLGDAAGEAKAHAVHAEALARLGRVGAAEAALDEALAAARRAGDRRRAHAVLAGAPLAALWGPSPVTRASGRCLDVVRVLRITQGAPAVEAVALSCQGVLEALRGRGAAARRMVATARTMVEELGITHRLYEADVAAARIDLLEGDAAAAERALRPAYDGLRELGLGIDAARAGALLARALLAQERVAEAETLSHESEALAGDDLQAAIAWRGVRAEALARRGEHAEAIALAEAAVAIAAATDALLDHAGARVALAAVLRAAGREPAADGEERRALALWEAKGATVLVERRGHGAPRGGAAPAGVPQGAPARDPKRVPPNAAYRAGRRFAAAVAAHDAAGLADLFADDLEVVDHPNGATYGRAAHLDSLARLGRMADATLEFEPLATLGESVLLWRRRIRASGGAGGRFDVGPSERGGHVVFEVADDGRVRRVEIFAADRLGHAVACLYERWAAREPAGGARDRAAMTARAVAFLVTPSALPDPLAVFAAAYEDVDHRTVGYGALTGEGASRLVEADRAVASDVGHRVDDVLALSPRGLVRLTTTSGVWRDGGGAFERTICRVTAFDARGQVARHDTYDPARVDDALARFDALASVDTPAAANAAARAFRSFAAAWRARDWDAVRATYHPAHRMDDRRRLMRVTVAGDAFFANERLLFDDTASDWQGELVAARGERLALFRVRFTATVAGSGPLEVEMLDLVEVDAAGRRTALVVFDVDEEAAARAELDARSEAGAVLFANAATRAMARQEAAWKAGDWEGSSAGFLPGHYLDDRRSLVRLRVAGDDFLAQLRMLFDLPRSRWHFEPLATRGEQLALGRVLWESDVDAAGGAAVAEYLEVYEVDAAGRSVASVLFDPDDRKTAEAELDARYEAGEGAGYSPSPHAFVRAIARREWSALAALCAPSFVQHDHRPFAILGTIRGAEAWAESFRVLVELAPDSVPRIVHLRRSPHGGLLHVVWQGSRDGARYETPLVVVTAVDTHGRFVRGDVYDPEQLDAARARFDALALGTGRASAPS